MGIILGIDIGCSTTKVVGLRQDGSVLGMLRTKGEDQLTSLFGAMGSFIASNQLSLHDIDRICLTGQGASFVDGDIYGIPTTQVDEFNAVGKGALALAGRETALVVSMGTGTSFLYVNHGRVKHICGSGIGGGTLGGLCRRLVGMERFGQIKRLAADGELKNIDLMVGDISRNSTDTLSAELTAANFGNVAEDASGADLAAGVVNLVLQAIGTMTVLATKTCPAKEVILTGSVTTLDQTRPNFETFERFYGIHYIIPENATFATAYGAALHALGR